MESEGPHTDDLSITFQHERGATSVAFDYAYEWKTLSPGGNVISNQHVHQL